MHSYTIRLSIITKEYKEVPLAQRKIALTLRNMKMHKARPLNCGRE